MLQANEMLIGMTLPYFALEACRERVSHAAPAPGRHGCQPTPAKRR